MPAMSIPPNFTDSQFWTACLNMEDEMVHNNSFGPTPAYPYHPAYDLVVEMADLLLERGISPLRFIDWYLGWHEEDYEPNEPECIREVLDYLQDVEPTDREILASIVPTPARSFSFDFDARALLEAGLDLDAEGWDARPRGPRPAFNRFAHLMRKVLAAHVIPLDFCKEELEADVASRFAEAPFMEFLRGWNGYTNGHYVHPRLDTPVPFTSQEFYMAGKALEQEMLSNECDDPVPRYFPHPAYDRAAAWFEELYARHINACEFARESLTQQQHLYFHRERIHYILERWQHSKDHIFFDYNELQNPFEEPVAERDVGYLDFDQPTSTTSNYGQVSQHNATGTSTDSRSPWRLPVARVVHTDVKTRARDLVNSLGQPSLSSVVECPICYLEVSNSSEAASSGDHIPVKTPCCRQIFDTVCLIKSLCTGGMRCPMCRQNIATKVKELAQAEYDVNFPPLGSVQ